MNEHLLKLCKLRGEIQSYTWIMGYVKNMYEMLEREEYEKALYDHGEDFTDDITLKTNNPVLPKKIALATFMKHLSRDLKTLLEKIYHELDQICRKELGETQ